MKAVASETQKPSTWLLGRFGLMKRAQQAFGRECKVWRFVLQENIDHLRMLISTLQDPNKISLLQAELKEAEDELAELNRLSALVDEAHNTSYADLLTIILRDEVRQRSANFGLIHLLDLLGSSLKLAAQLNFRTQFLLHYAEVRAGDGSVYGKALADGDAVWVEDMAAETDFSSEYLGFARSVGFRAVKSLPLLRPSGHMFGMFSLHYIQAQRWADQDRLSDRRIAQGVANSVLNSRPPV